MKSLLIVLCLSFVSSAFAIEVSTDCASISQDSGKQVSVASSSSSNTKGSIRQ